MLKGGRGTEEDPSERVFLLEFSKHFPFEKNYSRERDMERNLTWALEGVRQSLFLCIDYQDRWPQLGDPRETHDDSVEERKDVTDSRSSTVD